MAIIKEFCNLFISEILFAGRFGLFAKLLQTPLTVSFSENGKQIDKVTVTNTMGIVIEVQRN